MNTEKSDKPQAVLRSDRLAGASLGLAAGLIFGVALGVVSLVVPGLSIVHFLGWVFGTAGGFACLGFFWPRLSYRLVFGTIRVLFQPVGSVRSSVACWLLAALFYGYAWITLASGRLPGRGGLTSLTATGFPALYWGFVALCLTVGTLCLLYSVGKSFNIFVAFTRAVEHYAEERQRG